MLIKKVSVPRTSQRREIVINTSGIGKKRQEISCISNLCDRYSQQTLENNGSHLTTGNIRAVAHDIVR